MSPTSFQTAPSRAMKLLLIIFVIKRMGRGGFEPPKQFAADLQSVPFGHSGICPFTHNMKLCEKPMIGLEPITCWLQISCSANWATSALMTPTGIEPVLPPWKGDVLTAWPWSQIPKSLVSLKVFSSDRVIYYHMITVFASTFSKFYLEFHWKVNCKSKFHSLHLRHGIY